MTLRCIVVFISLFFSLNLLGQTYEEDIIKLIEIDGSFFSIEELTEHANRWAVTTLRGYYNAKDEFIKLNVEDSFVEDLKDSLVQKYYYLYLNQLVDVYKKQYSHQEIKRLLKFYKTDLGRKFNELNTTTEGEIGLIRIYCSGSLESSLDYYLKEEGKKNKNEEILNLPQVRKVSFEEDEEAYNINFRFEYTGSQDTFQQTVFLTNNTNKPLEFLEKSLHNESLILDYGDKPILPKEERKLKFTFYTKCHEGQSSYSQILETNFEKRIYLNFGIDLPSKKEVFSTSSKELKYEDFDGEYSKPYQFKLLNEGDVDIIITGCDFDSKLIFVNYDKTQISKGEEVTVTAIYSKKAIEEDENESLNTTINLHFRRCSSVHYLNNVFFEIIEP